MGRLLPLAMAPRAGGTGCGTIVETSFPRPGMYDPGERRSTPELMEASGLAKIVLRPLMRTTAGAGVRRCSTGREA
jgi:hypothetical protein